MCKMDCSLPVIFMLRNRMNECSVLNIEPLNTIMHRISVAYSKEYRATSECVQIRHANLISGFYEDLTHNHV